MSLLEKIAVAGADGFIVMPIIMLIGAAIFHFFPKQRKKTRVVLVTLLSIWFLVLMALSVSWLFYHFRLG